MNPFTTTQFELSKKLNVPADELRKRRAQLLAEGTDWQQQGNHVVYTDAAVEKIRASLGLTPHKEPEASASNPEPQKAPDAPRAPQPVANKPPGEVTLIVYRIARNTRILEAHEKHKDPIPLNLVRVQVRDNSNFTRGMELQATLINPPDLYAFVGRLPRFRGKY